MVRYDLISSFRDRCICLQWYWKYTNFLASRAP